jgi:hypothetical protein
MESLPIEILEKIAPDTSSRIALSKSSKTLHNKISYPIISLEQVLNTFYYKVGGGHYSQDYPTYANDIFKQLFGPDESGEYDDYDTYQEYAKTTYLPRDILVVDVHFIDEYEKGHPRHIYKHKVDISIEILPHRRRTISEFFNELEEIIVRNQLKRFAKMSIQLTSDKLLINLEIL